MKTIRTWPHECILLPFNTVVTRRYALCIKYNQYAQPQKCVTKVATNYMAIYLFFKNYKSASSERAKIIMKRRSFAHSMFMANIHKQLLVCLYQLYKSVCTGWPIWNTRPHVPSGGLPTLRSLANWRLFCNKLGEKLRWVRILGCLKVNVLIINKHWYHGI